MNEIKFPPNFSSTYLATGAESEGWGGNYRHRAGGNTSRDALENYLQNSFSAKVVFFAFRSLGDIQNGTFCWGCLVGVEVEKLAKKLVISWNLFDRLMTSFWLFLVVGN